MADYYPETEERKTERRIAFWKKQVDEVAKERDRWRQCPDPYCPRGGYLFSSQARLWRHIREWHGAK